MAKTYAQIQKEIEKLQARAEEARAKEIAGVVARIREAIAHYGLTQSDLFGAAAPRGSRRGRQGAKSRDVSAGRRRASGVIRYRDEAGNAWTGRGRRPGWFVQALANGKTPDDLAVKA